VASVPGIGSYYSGLCDEGCCPSFWTSWDGEDRRFYFFSTFLGLTGFPLQVGVLKCSHQVTDLRSVFGSSVHRAGCNWDLSNSLPVCARWSELMFFASLQLCYPAVAVLTGQFFLHQGGKFSFEYRLSDLPSPCFERLACFPTPAVSLCYFSHLAFIH
jgi:hypothetical protein